MSATALGAILGVSAAYAASVFAILRTIGSRLDRIEDRLMSLEKEVAGLAKEVARIGQQLVDHTGDHPGPTERLVR